MSECEDMTTIMAKELMLGIKDNVEDVAAAFKKMAILHPRSELPDTEDLPTAAYEAAADNDGALNIPVSREPREVFDFFEFVPMPVVSRKGKKHSGPMQGQFDLFGLSA